jgi:hypothetical protein
MTLILAIVAGACFWLGAMFMTFASTGVGLVLAFLGLLALYGVLHDLPRSRRVV